MILKYTEQRVRVIEKAIDLLNSVKHTDFKLESYEQRYGMLATKISSKRFGAADVSDEFLFSDNWFDSEYETVVDELVDYGDLTGEDKLIARCASYLNACHHMPGRGIVYLRQQASKRKK